MLAPVLSFSRPALVLVTLLAVVGGACGGGTSSGAGGGSADPAFQSDDLGGVWAGSLNSPGKAGIPMAFSYSANGIFLSLGEAYRSHTIKDQASFSDKGALHLRSHTADGSVTLDLEGTMNTTKTSITGSWQRFDNQINANVPIESGSFVASTDQGGTSKADLAGNWAGDFYSTTNARLTTAMLVANSSGNLSEFQEFDQHFQSNFDDLICIQKGTGLSLAMESPTLFIRYELDGSLNEQHTVFTGTWRYFDLWAGGGAIDSGTFTLHKSLGAFPRTVAEVQGLWTGSVTDPAKGPTTLDIEYDASGNVLSGTFGEYGFPPVDLVFGTTQFENASIGMLESTVHDEITQGSQDIILRGVLSPVSGVWSGSFSHYFYGPGRFVIEAQ